MGFDDARNRTGTVSWIVRDEGWWTLNWISVFKFCPGVVRFTNRFNVRPPARQWPYALPSVHPFELNAALAEVDDSLLEEVVAHAQAAREITPWPQTAPPKFSDAHGAHFAWTPLGKSLADKHHQREAHAGSPGEAQPASPATSPRSLAAWGHSAAANRAS